MKIGKSYIKYFVIISLLSTMFLMTGCSKEYVYVHPEYPKLTAPRKVPEIKGAFIRKECLWLKNHNTNLCGNDLKVVLVQIKKLRVNEKICIEKINSYNEFIRNKKKR